MRQKDGGTALIEIRTEASKRETRCTESLPANKTAGKRVSHDFRVFRLSTEFGYRLWAESKASKA